MMMKGKKLYAFASLLSVRDIHTKVWLYHTRGCCCYHTPSLTIKVLFVTQWGVLDHHIVMIIRNRNSNSWGSLEIQIYIMILRMNHSNKTYPYLFSIRAWCAWWKVHPSQTWELQLHTLSSCCNSLSTNETNLWGRMCPTSCLSHKFDLTHLRLVDLQLLSLSLSLSLSEEISFLIIVAFGVEPQLVKIKYPVPTPDEAIDSPNLATGFHNMHPIR
jgi:hypothetical protein